MAELDTLFAQGLQRLYAAHRQTADEAAAARRTATSDRVRGAMAAGAHANRTQARRLMKVFRGLGLRPGGQTNPVIEGIHDAHAGMSAEADGPLARDLVHLASGQIAEHFFIATYGTLRDYAQALGLRREARLLDKTLREAAYGDRRMTEVARSLTHARGRRHNHPLRAIAALGALAGAVALVRAAPKR